MLLWYLSRRLLFSAFSLKYYLVTDLVFLYYSCICSMNVTVRRSEADADEEFHFVIKSPPKSSFIRMMHKFSRPFFNEVTWYNDLIPMLEVVNGKNCIERMLPKCYFAYSNYYMQVQVIYFFTFSFTTYF